MGRTGPPRFIFALIQNINAGESEFPCRLIACSAFMPPEIGYGRTRCACAYAERARCTAC